MPSRASWAFPGLANAPTGRRWLRASDFGFLSSFVIRHSSFGFAPSLVSPKPAIYDGSFPNESCLEAGGYSGAAGLAGAASLVVNAARGSTAGRGPEGAAEIPTGGRAGCPEHISTQKGFSPRARRRRAPGHRSDRS